jgi:hypothetical protein
VWTDVELCHFCVGVGRIVGVGGSMATGAPAASAAAGPGGPLRAHHAWTLAPAAASGDSASCFKFLLDNLLRAIVCILQGATIVE